MKGGRKSGPQIEVLPDAPAVSRRAAAHLAAELQRRRRSTLMLASGRTMAPIYRALTRLHRAGKAPFAKAETFNLDELCVAPEDPRSFRAFMERHLFSRVDLPRDRIHFLKGNAADPERECARYEREISGSPVDLALAGIGVNGHVAYLEPGRSLAPRTARVRLSRSTRARLAGGGMRPVPREALTVGIETLLSSRRILMVATGREKAAAVANALQGPISPRCPASFLSLHPALTVLLDRPAARLLD